jgi:hypothetical protein
VRRNWIGIAILAVGYLSTSADAFGQVYGYTDENGVLILSNVPSDPRMRLIAEGNPEEAGKIWRYTGQYDALILEAATYAGLDSALVKAVIAVESGFNRFARSHKGAMGLMQLMPDTCRRYGVANPYDARQNVRAGAKHLRDLLDEFNELHLSLAAYNAGATPVRRLGRIPPYRETRDYVRKVMAIYRAGSKISITKGGKTYTIIGQGGRTRVQPARTRSPSSSGQSERRAPGEGSRLAEIAAASRQPARLNSGTRRKEGSSIETGRTEASKPFKEHTQTPEAVSAPNATSAESLQADEVEPTGDDPLYYRYKDANGVIYITRTKPADVEYEVLRR